MHFYFHWKGHQEREGVLGVYLINVYLAEANSIIINSVFRESRLFISFHYLFAFQYNVTYKEYSISKY